MVVGDATLLLSSFGFVVVPVIVVLPLDYVDDDGNELDV